MPHMIYLAVAFISAVIFILMAFAMTIADFELNPLIHQGERGDEGALKHFKQVPSP